MTIYLYVKTHNITGLKYLGKTIRHDYEVYRGSGIYWNKHLRKHGNDVSTQILLASESAQEIHDTGLFFSELWDVVNSKDWANLIPENGVGGAPKGKSRGPSCNFKPRKKKIPTGRIRDYHHKTDKRHTEEAKDKMRISMNSSIARRKLPLAERLSLL